LSYGLYPIYRDAQALYIHNKKQGVFAFALLRTAEGRMMLLIRLK